MAGSGSLVLRPWIRQLVLGSETFSGPRAGQLLEVLQEAQAPSPPRTPGVSSVGAALLVSDGTHSIRCRLTRNALNTSDWEKEFGFRGTEGRLLLVQDCGVRVQVAEDGAPTEFYLQVDRFSLLPTEQPRVRVAGCNQDPDVKKKLSDCLEEYLSEPTSPSPDTSVGWPVTLSPRGVTSPATTSSISPLHLSRSFSVSFGSSPGPLPPGLTLSQLLSEVPEDQEHRGALVHLAESCLLLAGPLTAPPITRWAASRHRNTGDTVFTVPSLWLHISENDQQILSSLGPGPELPPPDSALQDLCLTLTSSPSSSGTPPELPGHTQSEESSASINLLPALSLVTADPVQRDSSQSQPTIDSTPDPSCSPHASSASSSTFLSCTSSLLSLDHVPSAYQAHVTRAQKPSLEFKGLGLPSENQRPSSRTSATKEAMAPSSTWDSPKRHRDGSAFQYEYSPPCTSLCAQVQAARLPPELVAWALHFLTEPSPESELTQV